MKTNTFLDIVKQNIVKALYFYDFIYDVDKKNVSIPTLMCVFSNLSDITRLWLIFSTVKWTNYREIPICKQFC